MQIDRIWDMIKQPDGGDDEICPHRYVVLITSWVFLQQLLTSCITAATTKPPGNSTGDSIHCRILTCCCVVWYEGWEEEPSRQSLALSETSGLSWDRPPSPWQQEHTLNSTAQTFLLLGANTFPSAALLVSCDDHVAFGFAVIAHAFHAVDLGQLVDDPPVFSVHGWETVALLWLFSLQTPDTM